MDMQLVIISGPDRGRNFELRDGQTLVIGRGRDSQTQLTDSRVSRVHCQIEVDGGNVILLDLQSSSGTKVNGDSVAKHCSLKPGDVIQLGDTQLRYQLEQAPEESTLVGRPPVASKKPPAAMPLRQMVGQSVAHFELQELLAEGASGLVFKAQDTQDNRTAAVKILWPEQAGSEDSKQRFVRAMKTMLPVRHENIVAIYAA